MSVSPEEVAARAPAPTPELAEFLRKLMPPPQRVHSRAETRVRKAS